MFLAPALDLPPLPSPPLPLPLSPAMNKVDRLYSWQSVPNSPIQDAFNRQEEYVRKEFDDRLNQVGLVSLRC